MAQQVCHLRVRIPFWCFPAVRALIFVMMPILALANWIASRVRVVAE